MHCQNPGLALVPKPEPKEQLVPMPRKPPRRVESYIPLVKIATTGGTNIRYLIDYYNQTHDTDF